MRRLWFARLPLVLVMLVGLGLTVASGPLQPQVASASIVTTTSFCGTVQAYVAATPFSAGSLTLGGTTYGIAPGAILANDYLIASGVPVCVSASFNSIGQITSGTVTLASGAPLSVCGIVTSFIPATASTPGSIVIGGVTYIIAPGVTITGFSFTAGTTAICIQATLNPSGQMIGVTINGFNAGTLRLCGSVTGYIPATPLTPGSITINGQNLSIAPGVFFGGSPIQVGADLCLIATVAPNLQIIGGTVTQNTSFNTVVCGLVTNYIPATPGSIGTITIGGQTFTIAASGVITNDTLTVSGAPLCLNAVFNGSGQITSGVLTPQSGSTSTINVCGVVTGYVAPTSTVAGSVGIGGTPYPIAPGASISGAGILTIGTSVCLQGTLNSAGQIVSATATFNGGVQVTICGLASLYTAATSTMPGSLTIAGITFPIAAGVTFSGGTVLAPATLGLTLTLNGQGAITAGTVTATGCNGQSISGPITNYVPPTATTAGSITIGGITYPVAAGTVLTVGTGVPLAATPVRVHGGLREIPS